MNCLLDQVLTLSANLTPYLPRSSGTVTSVGTPEFLSRRNISSRHGVDSCIYLSFLAMFRILDALSIRFYSWNIHERIWRAGLVLFAGIRMIGCDRCSTWMLQPSPCFRSRMNISRTASFLRQLHFFVFDLDDQILLSTTVHIVIPQHDIIRSLGSGQ
jgi:hypothetical protein